MKKFGYLAPTYRLVDEICRLKQSSARMKFKFRNVNELYAATVKTMNEYRHRLFLKDNEIRTLTHENSVFSNRDLSARQMSTHAIADVKEGFVNKTNEALKNQRDRLTQEFEESISGRIESEKRNIQQDLSSTSDELEKAEAIIESQRLKLEKITKDYSEQCIAVELLSCQLSAVRTVNNQLAQEIAEIKTP